VGGKFHRLVFVGRISHFVAEKTTYVPIEPVQVHQDIAYIPPVRLTARNHEYLVDIIDNKVWNFDPDGLERVLKNDPPLRDEFNALKEREKEKMKYVYLRRYNEKYPLNIPAY
jgi:hypothetical protein